MSLVEIKYKELYNHVNLNDKIRNAFSENGFGAIIITEIPDFKFHKMKLLKLSKQFGELPEAIQQKYERPETLYSFGWSRGKEKLKNGIPDIAKGSFYANPIIDIPTTDKELIKKYPTSYSRNIWPTEHIPTFESHFKYVGKIMTDIGLKVIEHCDNYLDTEIDNYPQNYIKDLMLKCNTYKGRLLHYYEQPKEENKKQDSACGWHLDHGGLTVLTKALYLDQYYQEVEQPDNSGLYIKDRNNNIHHVKTPDNSLICQIGETLQILSGGYLKATPHCVRSTPIKGVTRETFPVFIDFHVNQNINLSIWSKNDVLKTEGMKDLDLPKLLDRYNKCNKTYSNFSEVTYKTFL